MANDKLIYASAARKAILKADPKLAYCIDDIKGVDSVEVVHGRWVMTLYKTTSKRGRVISNQKFACSVCGYGNGRKQSNYCPHCGAKMDGGNKGE